MSQPSYPYVVTIATPGPRGPQGEQGPSGSQGPQGEPGVTTPGGNNTEIQFNNGGAFGGNPNFTYDLSNNIVTLTGSFTISSSNTFTNIGPAVFSGNISASSIYVSESLIVNNSPVLTSTNGTASYSNSSSYAITASYALNSENIDTSSIATTGSNVFVGDQTIDGVLIINNPGLISASRLDGSNYNASELYYNDGTTEGYVGIFNGGYVYNTLNDGVNYNEFQIYGDKAISLQPIEAPSFTGSLQGTADYAVTASYVGLIPGDGISISGKTITSKLTTINGIAPTSNGNVSVNLAYTITGNSSSLVASSSGAITSSISDGSIWVIAGDVDPNNNGDTYIFVASSSLATPPGVGQWLPIAPLDTAAGDARYLKLTPQSPLAGALNLGGYNINNVGVMSGSVLGNVQGTSSWATSASQAVTASHALTTRTAGSNGNIQYRLSATQLGSVPVLRYVGGLLTGTGSFSGSFVGTFNGPLIGTASHASTASLAPNYVLNSATSSFATLSGSNGFTGNNTFNSNVDIGTSLVGAQLTINGSSSQDTPLFIKAIGKTRLKIQSLGSSVDTGFILNNNAAGDMWSMITSASGAPSPFYIRNEYLGQNVLSINPNSNAVAINGALTVTGNVSATSSWASSASYALTASYVDTASYAYTSSQAITASIAQTASFIPTGTYQVTASWAISSSQAISASTAQTASFLPVNTYQITASRAVSASNAITASYALAVAGAGSPGGNPSEIQFNNAGVFGGVPTLTYTGSILRVTGSFTGSLVGSLTGTSSWAESSSRALTTSYALTSAGTVTNAVNAQTASYLINNISNNSDFYGATGTGTTVYVKDAINPLTGLPYGTGGLAAAEARWNLVKERWSIDEIDFTNLTNFPIGGTVTITTGIQTITCSFSDYSYFNTTTSASAVTQNWKSLVNNERYRSVWAVDAGGGIDPSANPNSWAIWTKFDAINEIAKDFNNGISANNALLLGAVATGSKVIIYSKSTTPVTASFAGGVTISPAPTITRTKTFNASTINMTTDTVDWVALQQALYEVETSNVNKRVLDLGYEASYILSRGLDLPTKIGLSGVRAFTINGNNSTLTALNNTRMKLMYRDVPQQNYALSGITSNLDRINVRDLKFKFSYYPTRDTNPKTQAVGLMLVGYQCTVENCDFEGGDIGLDVQFGLQTMVRGCKFNIQNLFGLAIRNGQWFGAELTDAQSNGTIVDSCRWRLYDYSGSLAATPNDPQFAGLYVAGASDCSLRNLIFEGGLSSYVAGAFNRPSTVPNVKYNNYGIIVDTLNATTVKDIEIYNVHFEKYFYDFAMSIKMRGESIAYIGKIAPFTPCRILDFGNGPVMMSVNTKFGRYGNDSYTSYPKANIENWPYKPDTRSGVFLPFITNNTTSLWRVTDCIMPVSSQPTNSTAWNASGASYYITSSNYTQSIYDGHYASPTYNTIQSVYFSGSNNPVIPIASRAIVSNLFT